MTISERFLRSVKALRSFLERLLLMAVGLEVMMLVSIALMKVSRAASLPLGGVHEPLRLKRVCSSSGGLVESVRFFCWKNSRSCNRLAKSFMSACSSDQLIRLGVGTKDSPRDNNLVSELESCAEERLITVSASTIG